MVDTIYAARLDPDRNAERASYARGERRAPTLAVIFEHLGNEQESGDRKITGSHTYVLVMLLLAFANLFQLFRRACWLAGCLLK